MENKILHLKMNVIVNYSTIDEERGLLVVDEVGFKKAVDKDAAGKAISTNGYTCHLIDQMQKALFKNDDYTTNIAKIFYIMDFVGCGDNDYKKLAYARNGIELSIDGEKIIIVDYLKSSSMSRESKIYYIDKRYYSLINPRITFGLDEEADRVDLSKWYAYTGLVISDCHLIDGIRFNADEVVIVEDKEVPIDTDCLTAVSAPLLFEDINKLIGIYSKQDDIDIKYSINTSRIYKKLECYKNSDDFNSLSNELKEIITTCLSITSKDEYISSLKSIKKKYAYLDDDEETVVWEKINVHGYPVDVNYYDGEGLISMELDEEINLGLRGVNLNSLHENDDDSNEEFNDDRYSLRAKSHSFQIRLPFIKGVVHSCDFKAFFKEHNIKTILGKTYNGNEKREYDVSKVKMILTESQFKMSRFISNLKLLSGEAPIDAYFRLLNEYSYAFGISNVESASKHDYVKLCYQFFSTMPLGDIESEDIRKSNIKYINIISDDKEVIDNLKNVNNQYKALLDIYEVSPEFVYKTDLFKNIKNKQVALEKKNTNISKMNVEGTRKFLSGDLLGLLYHIIGKPLTEYNSLKLNEIYLPNTGIPYLNSPVAVLRNPHYSRNEIKMLWPSGKQAERDKYFGHLTGVCMTNPLSFTAHRLGGADYDGDSVIITWQRDLAKCLYNNLVKDNKEVYPLVVIPSIKSRAYKINYDNKLMCIRNTFKSFVGKISDQCFKEAENAYNEGRYDDVAFYTILNGLEIDSAKNGRKPKLPAESDNISKAAECFINLKKALKKDKQISGLVKELSSYDGCLYKNVGSLSRYVINSQPLSPIEIKKNNKISAENAIELASILNAYSSFNNALKRFKNYSRDFSNKNMEALYRKLNTILEANGYKIDIDELLNDFKTNNPYDTLKYYLDDKIYYAKDNDEKEISLVGLSLNNASKESKEAVLNYDNEGFEALYLILYYHKEAQSRLVFRNEYLNTCISNSRLKSLDKDYKNKILDRTKAILSHIESIEDKYISEQKELSKSLNSVNEEAIDYFKSLANSFTINDLAYVCNIFRTNIIFDVFEYKLKLELLQMKEGK